MSEGTTNERTGRAAALITIAFFFVAMMGAISKLAKHVPVEMLVFFQSFIALVIFSPYVFRKGPSQLKTMHLKFHLLRSFSGLISQVLMLIAVRKTLIANAVLLSNSSPLIIPILAKIFLKKKISKRIWMSLIIGLVGIVLILDPSKNIFENWVTLIALASAFFSAVALLSVNELSKIESKELVLFYYFLISSLASLPFAVSHWQRPQGMDWIYLIGIGLSMLFGQLLIIFAYKYASASRVAPFNYTVVVFSALMGLVFWHEVPKFGAIVGIVLVSIGGILTTNDPKKEPRGGH